jgi:hypothetical protein
MNMNKFFNGVVSFDFINDEYFFELSETIKENHTLTKIDLSKLKENVNTGNCYNCLREILLYNSSIKSLILSQNKINIQEILIVNDIINFNNIKILDLSKNDLFDETLSLMDGFIKNYSLKELNLSGNKLRNEKGLLNELLKNNNSLTKLNLSSKK